MLTYSDIYLLTYDSIGCIISFHPFIGKLNISKYMETYDNFTREILTMIRSMMCNSVCIPMISNTQPIIVKFEYCTISIEIYKAFGI